MSVQLTKKKISYRSELADDLPDIIHVDGGKLSQILTNLFANAIKFTNSGTIVLRVKVSKWESPQLAQIYFEIEDSGIGISKQDQEKIFSPFEQVGDQPSQGSGTGLGLAICQQYMELFDGTIGVHSEVGEGATFYISFPVEIATEPERRTPILANRSVLGLTEGQPQFRLLIAEDKLENRLLLRSLLEPLGFEIMEAVNGQEAVEKCKQWHPHLIWMDIRMPVLNGLEATRIIKDSGTDSTVKIVALTAHALEEERLEILEAGCDEFIRKPYRDIEIYDSLVKQLGVKFEYSDDVATLQSNSNKLKSDAFDHVPPDLLMHLKNATVMLDEEQCLGVIGQISDTHQSLGQILRGMVEEYAYAEILAALGKQKGVGER